MILVSQSNDEVQIMDPITYKTFELKKPKLIFYKSKIISTIKLEEIIFLLPDKIKGN